MALYPVVIYLDYQYSGKFVNLDYDSYPDLALFHANDYISSIKIAPFTKVILYSDLNFTGSIKEITGPAEIPDLVIHHLNDNISSIKVIKLIPSLQQQLDCCNGTTSGIKCGDWQQSSAKCESTYATHCTTLEGIATPFCRSWCTKNPAICDATVMRFCAANPGDPYCTCINSVATQKNIINPKCIDGACIKTGYLTSSMLASPCPSVINCEINASLTTNGVSLNTLIPIQQNCGSSPLSTEVINVKPPVIITENKVNIPVAVWSTAEIMLIFLIIILFIFTGVVIYFDIFEIFSAPESVTIV